MKNFGSFLPAADDIRLRSEVTKTVFASNQNVPACRRVTPNAATTVVERSLIASTGLPAALRHHLALVALGKYIDLAQNNRSKAEFAIDTDLLPVAHPRSTRIHAMTASALREAQIRWIVSDPRIEDEHRPLVAAALASEPNSVEHFYAISRLEAAQDGIALRALIAAFGDGNSSAARSARARRQRRDRKGRFAYMGGGLRNLIRRLSGQVESFSGRFVKESSDGDFFEMETPDGKIWQIPASKSEAIKGFLPKKDGDGYAGTAADYSSEDAEAIINEDDLVSLDAPSGYKMLSDEDGVKTFGMDDGGDDYTITQRTNEDGTREFVVARKGGDNAEVGTFEDWNGVHRAIVRDGKRANKADAIKARLDGKTGKEAQYSDFMDDLRAEAEGDGDAKNVSKAALEYFEFGETSGDETPAQLVDRLNLLAKYADEDGDPELAEDLRDAAEEITEREKSKATIPAAPEKESAASDVDWSGPEGSYTLTKPEIDDFKPKGRKGQDSADYTDDPAALAQTFDAEELRDGLKGALLGDEDSGAGKGRGIMPFEQDEFVPAAALHLAMTERGMDADAEVAKIYDDALGSDINATKLADARAPKADEPVAEIPAETAPEAPEAPEEPEVSEAPEEPETPEVSEAPEAPEAAEGPAARSKVSAKDVQPGDVTVTTQNGVLEYFAIEGVEETEEGKIAITGYFPGHVSQSTKQWNPDTDINVIRGLSPEEMPQKGDLPEISKPKRNEFGAVGVALYEDEDGNVVKKFYLKDPEAEAAYQAAFEEAKQKIGEAGARWADSDPTANLDEDAISEDKPLKPRRPHTSPFPPFQGRFAELVRESGGDWNKLKELLDNEELVFFDFETTGVRDADGNEPWQVAAVKVRNGEIIERKNIYMNPGRSIEGTYAAGIGDDGEPLLDEDGNPRVTARDSEGNPLTDEFLAQQPSQEEALKELLEWMGENPLLIAQNSRFDDEVFRRKADELDLDYSPSGIADTMSLAMALENKKSTKGFSLKDLSGKYGIEFSEEDWHKADADTEATKKLWDALIARGIKGKSKNALNVDAQLEQYQQSLADEQAKKEKFAKDMAEYQASKMVEQAMSDQPTDVDSAVEAVADAQIAEGIPAGEGDGGDADPNPVDVPAINEDDSPEADTASEPSSADPAFVSPDVVFGTQEAGPSGSNTKAPSGIWVGTDGKRRYVKNYTNEDQAINELIANRIYEELGIEVPPTALSEYTDPATGEKMTVITTEMVDNTGQVGLDTDADTARRIAAGFVADLWLANWDALGLVGDNIVRSPDGSVVRIDNGGSILYRAQGQHKNLASVADANPADFYSRNPNSPYAKLLRKAGFNSTDDLIQGTQGQADALRKKIDEMGGVEGFVDSIIDKVKADGGADVKDLNAERGRVIAALQTRLDSLDEYYGKKSEPTPEADAAPDTDTIDAAPDSAPEEDEVGFGEFDEVIEDEDEFIVMPSGMSDGPEGSITGNDAEDDQYVSDVLDWAATSGDPFAQSVAQEAKEEYDDYLSVKAVLKKKDSKAFKAVAAMTAEKLAALAFQIDHAEPEIPNAKKYQKDLMDQAKAISPDIEKTFPKNLDEPTPTPEQIEESVSEILNETSPTGSDDSADLDTAEDIVSDLEGDVTEVEADTTPADTTPPSDGDGPSGPSGSGPLGFTKVVSPDGEKELLRYLEENQYIHYHEGDISGYKKPVYAREVSGQFADVNGMPLAKGDRVVHPQFGEGIVVDRLDFHVVNGVAYRDYALIKFEKDIKPNGEVAPSIISTKKVELLDTDTEWRTLADPEALPGTPSGEIKQFPGDTQFQKKKKKGVKGTEQVGLDGKLTAPSLEEGDLPAEMFDAVGIFKRIDYEATTVDTDGFSIYKGDTVDHVGKRGKTLNLRDGKVLGKTLWIDDQGINRGYYVVVEWPPAFPGGKKRIGAYSPKMLGVLNEGREEREGFVSESDPEFLDMLTKSGKATTFEDAVAKAKKDMATKQAAKAAEDNSNKKTGAEPTPASTPDDDEGEGQEFDTGDDGGDGGSGGTPPITPPTTPPTTPPSDSDGDTDAGPTDMTSPKVGDTFSISNPDGSTTEAMITKVTRSNIEWSVPNTQETGSTSADSWHDGVDAGTLTPGVAGPEPKANPNDPQVGDTFVYKTEGGESIANIVESVTENTVRLRYTKPNGSSRSRDIPKSDLVDLVSSGKVTPGNAQRVALKPKKFEATPYVTISIDAPKQKGKPITGAPSIEEAVDIANKRKTEGHHHVVAYDGDAIANLEVSVVRAKIDGNEGTAVRFRLGKSAADKLLRAINKDRKSDIPQWKESQSIDIPRKNLGVDGFEINLNDKVKLPQSNNAKTFTRTLADGTVIRFYRSKGTGSGFVFGNNVEVFSPNPNFGKADLDAALLELGVTANKHDYTTAQALRDMGEKQLLSYFFTHKHDKGTFRGEEGKAERDKALQEIKDRYGITPDDLIYEITNDGRPQVSLPDDVVEQILKETGITGFYAVTSGTNVASVAQTGMLSTSQRVFRGIFGKSSGNWSPTADMGTGGADYVFLRPAYTDNVNAGGYSAVISVDGKSVIRRLDGFAYPNDLYGVKNPAHSKFKAWLGSAGISGWNIVEVWKNKKNTTNPETMVRKSIPVEDIIAYTFSSASSAQEAISKLQAAGISTINGVSVAEWIRSGLVKVTRDED